MTENKIDIFFVNFADDLTENVLKLSNEEILSRAKKRYDDPKKMTNNLKASIHDMVMENRRQRILIPAKEELEQRESSTAIYEKLMNKGVKGLKDMFDDIVSKSSGVPNTFMVACRNKENLSEQDMIAMLEDMYDLGLIDEDDI